VSKSDTLLVSEFSTLVRCITFAIFVYLHIIFCSLNVWYQSQVSSVQMDSPAGWCTIAHCEKHHELRQKGECFIHRASDVASKQPWFKPRWLCCLGALQQQVYYHNWEFTTVDQLKQAIVEEWNKISYHSASLTAALTSGVVVLLGLYCTAAGRTHWAHKNSLWISSSECWNCSNCVNIWCYLVN